MTVNSIDPVVLLAESAARIALEMADMKPVDVTLT